MLLWAIWEARRPCEPREALTACFASRMRPMTAEEGFRVTDREPRSMTFAWMSGDTAMRARAALSSNRLSTMNCSTSCDVAAPVLGPEGVLPDTLEAVVLVALRMEKEPALALLRAASFFIFPSRMRPITAALALMQSAKVPRSITSAWTSGVSVRMARAAFSSTLLSLMKSSTCSRVGSGRPLAESFAGAPASEVTPLCLMSLMRPMTAALALKQSTKVPRSTTHC
mmetsp:Transcript_35402/g.95982  ORF Transcript_35402/g.95982 Transcript_35402/m.95982 type:complete len:227 (-) Transcript_35402:394-1074(-)